MLSRSATCLLSRIMPPTLTVIPVRTTVWPKDYIEPIFRKEKLEEMGEETKPLAFSPVKAARSSLSSSGIFYDPVIWRLETMIMKHGKRQTAKEVKDGVLGEIKRLQLEKYREAKTDEERASIELNPVTIAKIGLQNMAPVVITKPIKRGGATYQVPHPITAKFSEFLAMKWLIDIVHERPKPKKENIWIVMARELIAAYNNEGKVVKKKLDMHRQCEANKAYAHYRWG